MGTDEKKVEKIKVRNPLLQSIRTLIWDEATEKFVEKSLRGKEVVEVSGKLSPLLEQQLKNGALQKMTAGK